MCPISCTAVVFHICTLSLAEDDLLCGVVCFNCNACALALAYRPSLCFLTAVTTFNAEELTCHVHGAFASCPIPTGVRLDASCLCNSYSLQVQYSGLVPTPHTQPEALRTTLLPWSPRFCFHCFTSFSNPVSATVAAATASRCSCRQRLAHGLVRLAAAGSCPCCSSARSGSRSMCSCGARQAAPLLGL